ncbi:MAG: hypothetical protein D6788_02220 [Planctomycetota bacterium]|nr:MAG: hypothetical protein D6788_02220 [Planctomycetota bacterium]
MLGLASGFLGGCGTGFPWLVGRGSETAGGTKEARIMASVTSLDPDTGLPETLSGTLAGDFEGTYEETILEVFLGEDGTPLAAVSRTELTIESPATGTLTSLNLIIVVEPIVSTDESSGQNVPIGLMTAATGEVIHGRDAFEGTVGQLYSDSSLLFQGGDAGMGMLESDLLITLSP